MKIEIAYLGADIRYFESLQGEFREKYGQQDQLLFQLFEVSESVLDYVQKLREIEDARPDILYLDFGKDPQEVAKLCQLLRHLESTRDISIVGLFNQVDDAQRRLHFMQVSMQAGIVCSQIKNGGELHDPVYHAYTMAFPELTIRPNFYSMDAKNGLAAKLIENFRINYLHHDHLQFESNQSFEVGQVIELETKIPIDVIPSKLYKIISVSSGNHYYPARYKIQARYLYLDPVFEKEAPDKIEKAKILEAKEERERSIMDEVIPAFKDWIESIMTESSPKNVKILVVDKKLQLLDQLEDWIGDQDYSLKLQTLLRDTEEELDFYRPSIIAFEKEDIPIEEVDLEGKTINVNPAQYNGNVTIGKLIEKIKAIENYEPFVIVFNNGEVSSEDMKKDYAYPNFISKEKHFNTAALLNVLEVYKKNFDARFDHFNREKFIPTKYEEFSHAYYHFPIKILGISESAMEFETDIVIKDWHNYQMNFPSNYYIGIVPQKKDDANQAGKKLYRGLIHSITLADKKALRSFVISNS
ncbi:MAG: hypothetical protein HN509_16970 [Halobacteriovoraceae bacterium]|jgi:hypothetical protein|nr:hypothetical protein [Halobacteriovoraceae bacterium]MBT5096081.1 hypothetical protein [Halobacteriovoraceae bacterium]